METMTLTQQTLQMLQVPNLLPKLSPKVEQKWRQALQIFRNDKGQSHGDIFTSTQVQIVDLIAKRRFPRSQLILPTQYGKSYSVADGILLRVSTHKEKWAIVAPSEEKARIIMDYIIDGIFADDIFLAKLEYNGTKETLKKERSKTRITFRGAGEVRVYTGNASNTQATKSALMGFGAPNIVLDEAGQIGDELYSTVKRMTGGSEGTDGGTFLLEIGNPVYRNHFHRTWFGERYMKIYVNDEIALAEGRYTREYLNEMKEEAGYDWMYRCIFPEANEVLPDGYRRLISDADLGGCWLDTMPALNWKHERPDDPNSPIVKNKYDFDAIDDLPVLGIDVAGTGSNKTVGALRFPKHNFAMKVFETASEDPNEQAEMAIEVIKKWGVTDYRIAVDAGGVGHGLAYILEEKGYLTSKILFGASKQGEVHIAGGYANIKAFLFWEARKWIKEGGKIVRDSGFLELNLINYKENASLKMQIEPKEAMIKRKANEGVKIESPDTADAFALTFIRTAGIVSAEDFVFD